jgi:predicted O-methyltransferase YrrM
VVAEPGGLRQYAVFLSRGLVGVAAGNGRLLWTYDKIAGGYPHTPIVRGDSIFCASGFGRRAGVALLNLVPGAEGTRVEEQYFVRQPLNAIQDGSVPIVVGDHAYEFDRQGLLLCIDVKTGQLTWQAKRGTSPGRSSMTYADQRFYLHSADGKMALGEVTSTGYVERGSFSVPVHQPALGATAPVVAGDRLYVRENDVLLCYDVRANALNQRQQAPRTVVLPRPAAPNPDARARERTGKDRAPDAIFVPTPYDVVEKMLELAAVTNKDTLYDLGSGDGRIVIAAAKKHDCRAVGYEIDPELVKLARAAVEKERVQDHVRIEHEDVFTRDLGGADVIMVYLPPRMLERLLPQLEKLKPGARIVSHYFAIPGAIPDKTITVASQEDGNEHRLYLWTIPLKKDK